MPPTSAHFRMVERVVGEDLNALLVRLHLETGSWEEVARRLLTDHEVVVSGQTLRRWAKELDIEAAAS